MAFTAKTIVACMAVNLRGSRVLVVFSMESPDLSMPDQAMAAQYLAHVREWRYCNCSIQSACKQNKVMHRLFHWKHHTAKALPFMLSYPFFSTEPNFKIHSACQVRDINTLSYTPGG
jgi:hypothetical protein